MNKRNVLIVGAGRFAQYIAQKFYELGHEVMVVDKDEKNIENILPYSTQALIGDATNPDFIKSLGIPNYDVCIVTIGDDFQASLEATSLIKDEGGRLTVARASMDTQEKFLLKCGADAVIYPEKQLGEWTAITYSSSKIKGYTDLDGEFAIYEMEIPNEWIRKTAIDVDVRKHYNLNLLAVKKNKKVQEVVGPNTVFEEGETVMVLGRYKDVKKCFKI